jgi:hypothetical protein
MALSGVIACNYLSSTGSSKVIHSFSIRCAQPYRWIRVEASPKIRACIQELLMDLMKKWPSENMRDVVALFTTNRYRMGALVVLSAMRLAIYMYVIQLAANQIPSG